MADELRFTVTDVFLTQVEGVRHRRAKLKQAQVNLDLQVTRASYDEGSTKLDLDINYRVRIENEGEEGDPVADLGANAQVRVEASRPVGAADAESGALDPTHDLAVAAAHPYLRQEIRRIVAALDMAPLPFPVTYEQLESITSNP